jgi:hypothetical protein
VLVTGHLSTVAASVQQEAQRFRDMCTELHFTRPDEASLLNSQFRTAVKILRAPESESTAWLAEKKPLYLFG